MSEFLENMTKETTLKDAQHYIGKEFYKVALVFERLEGLGLIVGNGHHIAQDVAKYIEELVEERWREKK